MPEKYAHQSTNYRLFILPSQEDITYFMHVVKIKHFMALYYKLFFIVDIIDKTFDPSQNGKCYFSNLLG